MYAKQLCLAKIKEKFLSWPKQSANIKKSCSKTSQEMIIPGQPLNILPRHKPSKSTCTSK